MNRFVVFAVLFPILALIVFVALETIRNGAVPTSFWGSMTFVYVPAMPFAKIAAGVDHPMSNHALGARLFVTTATTGIATARAARAIVRALGLGRVSAPSRFA